MTVLHRLVSVLRWLVYRNRAEQELHDEVQAFVDMAAADKVRNGALSSEARRMAILDSGFQPQDVLLAASFRAGCCVELRRLVPKPDAAPPDGTHHVAFTRETYAAR